MIDKIKIRKFKEHNYKSIYFNGKTLRFKLDQNKEMTELCYPEFYDVKLTNSCEGECPWCYQNSSKDEKEYCNVVENFKSYFGNMDNNQKPFQIAFGGGEPTSHSKFIELMNACIELDITPNYTTNGMFVDKFYSKDIINCTKNMCGGVAVSTHSHLEAYWRHAVDLFLIEKIKTNLHIIISDKKSINRFVEIYKEYNELIDYFVLLPYEAVGRATNKKIEFDYLFEILKNFESVEKISYGANFYEELKKHKWLDIMLYSPEMFSKYLDLKDMKLYKSSFNLTEFKK